MKSYNVALMLSEPALVEPLSQAGTAFPELSLYICGPSSPASAAQLSADAVLYDAGTQSYLSQFHTAPGIAVEYGALDILRAVQNAIFTGESFALVGRRSVVQTAATLGEILNHDFRVCCAQTPEEICQAVSELHRSGISLILGDSTVQRTAQALSLPCIPLSLGPETTRDLLRQVRSLCQQQERQEQGRRIFQKIAKNCPLGIFLFDPDHNIHYANCAFSQTDLSELQAIMKELIPTIPEEGTAHLYKKYQGNTLDISAKQITVGSSRFILFYASLHPRMGMQRSVVSIENFDDIKQQGNFIFTSQEYLRPLLPKIKTLAETDLTLLIYGSTGSGKTSIARYIHLNSLQRSAPFIIVNCEAMTEKLWNSIASNINSPLYGHDSTIYFKHIHKLSLPMQQLVNDFFDDTAIWKRNRIIASSVYNLADLAATNEFMHSLYLKLCNATLYIPPVSERLEDVPQLASLCINHYNQVYGKQVIGLQEDAVALLESYNWSMNYEQLQKVMKQLIATTHKYYIPSVEVNAAIRSVLPQSQVTGNFTVDLTKSLDEIERSIIEHILLEENMSQASTAKRLKISRSTIWRKLKGT